MRFRLERWARHASAWAAVFVALAARAPAMAVAERFGGGLTVRWIGQDRHDRVGADNRLAPNDVQDLHLRIEGLDAGRAVAWVEVDAEGSMWRSRAGGNWRAVLERAPGSTRGELFLEPDRPDRGGRPFQVKIGYDDGATGSGECRSRPFDPLLRMPGAALQARWMGQDGADHVGPGPSVGPDGLLDARVRLGRLSDRVAIRSIRIDGPPGSGLAWEHGNNPKLHGNAELVRAEKSPGEADLFFQPTRDLAGKTLRVTVFFEDEKHDQARFVAGRFRPGARLAAAPLPRVGPGEFRAEWLGQDGRGPNRARPGDVHVVLRVPKEAASPRRARLSGSVYGAWAYRAPETAPIEDEDDPEALPLDVAARADHRSYDLFFPPCRDSRDETFSVCWVDAKGRTWLGKFRGGSSDSARCAPAPRASHVSARPGDDLQALVDRHGSVELAPGTYRLERPLDLKQPVSLKSARGDGAARAVLQFRQPADGPPWSAAIKVHASNTTLDGFDVRFEGPVRWNESISFGPAVIGMSDEHDPDRDEPKFHVVFRRLDLEAPAVAPHEGWVEALRLMRLVRARDGEISGNTLRGGPIELFGGPWTITDNVYRGTRPGTFSHGVFTTHNVHDLRVTGNRTSSPGASGKTWRFLVITGWGANDRVERNIVEGIGARDNDTIPWSNEPEIILTECYTVKYEGALLARSPEGTLLRIGRPQFDRVRPGDVVSVLSGPAAGSWRRVVQVLGPTAIVVDRPVPLETDAVSVAFGFVNDVYEANTIDVRGGRRSVALVLVGSHYGTRVDRNHLLGGQGLLLQAFPTERPNRWGWTHVPYLGGTIEGNVLEDCEAAGVIGVEHSPYVKSNIGRAYMSVSLRDNVVRWSPEFLAERERRAAATRDGDRHSKGDDTARGPKPGLVLGGWPSHDPNEMIVEAGGNVLDAPARHREDFALWARSVRFNSKRLVDRAFRLPAAPAPRGALRPAVDAPR